MCSQCSEASIELDSTVCSSLENLNYKPVIFHSTFFPQDLQSYEILPGLYLPLKMNINWSEVIISWWVEFSQVSPHLMEHYNEAEQREIRLCAVTNNKTSYLLGIWSWLLLLRDLIILVETPKPIHSFFHAAYIMCWVRCGRMITTINNVSISTRSAVWKWANFNIDLLIGPPARSQAVSSPEANNRVSRLMMKCSDTVWQELQIGLIQTLPPPSHSTEKKNRRTPRNYWIWMRCSLELTHQNVHVYIVVYFLPFERWSTLTSKVCVRP